MAANFTPSKLYLGSAYYPEHWPEENWAKDIRLMQEAGFTVARMGEFAWSTLEPEAGKFHFDWLDRAIAAPGGGRDRHRARHTDCRPACLAGAAAPGPPGGR